MKHAHVATRVVALHEAGAEDPVAYAAWSSIQPGTLCDFSLSPEEPACVRRKCNCSCWEMPSLHQLSELALAIECYLEQQPSHVAVLRCHGACHATRLGLAAYCLLKGITRKPAAALKLASSKLPCSLGPVEPSSLRYLRHVQAVLEDGHQMPLRRLHLRSLRIQGLPASCRHGSVEVHVASRPSGTACVQPVACLLSGEGLVLVGSRAVAALPALQPAVAREDALLGLLEGDVRVEVRREASGHQDVLFSTLFPTAAVHGRHLSLSKGQLDTVHSDMRAGTSLSLDFDDVPASHGFLQLPHKLSIHAGLAEDTPPASPSSIPAASSQAPGTPEEPLAPPTTPQQLPRSLHVTTPVALQALMHSPFDVDTEELPGSPPCSRRQSMGARAGSTPQSLHCPEGQAWSGEIPRRPGRTGSSPSLHQSSLFRRALSAARHNLEDDGDESKVSAPVTPSCPRPETSLDWSYDARAAVAEAAEELQTLIDAQQMELPPLACAEIDPAQAAAFIKWMYASWCLTLV